MLPAPVLLQSARSWVPPRLTLLTLGLLLVSLLHYLSGPTGAAWLEQLKWVALGAVAAGAPPIALKAWGALRSKVRPGGARRSRAGEGQAQRMPAVWRLPAHGRGLLGGL